MSEIDRTAGRNGFVSFHALVIMVFAAIAGAYLLKSAAKESGTAGSYFHKRSSSTAARAGMAAAVSQLESDTAQALALLAGYVANPSRQWLLGPASGAGSRRVQTMPTGQTYSARILSFDTSSRMIKIESEGGGPGGSVTRLTGLYRLDGLAGPEVRDQVTHALYVAGSGHAFGAPLQVEGPTYIGGGFLLQPGGAGTSFQGPFKVSADIAGTPTVLQGSATFNDMAWFESPLRLQASATFKGSVGFDDEVTLNAGASVQGSGRIGYANGGFTGVQRLDMGGNPFLHSGFVPPARVSNAASVRKLEEGESISAKLGVSYGTEEEMRMDFSGLPAGKITYASTLGLPDAFTAMDLELAYHKTFQSARIGPNSKFQVIVVDKPLSLVRGSGPKDNECYKPIFFIVRSVLNIDGNLWKTTVGTYGGLNGIEGNVAFYVPAGGVVNGLGGNDRFRGYVHVEDGGTVTYKWGPGGSLVGAVHHVGPTAKLGLVGPHPFRIRLDQPTLDDLATAGIIRFPAVPAPPPPSPRMADLRIRPKLVGMYY